MFKNYLLVAVRNFSHSKTLSFINVFGLSFGIACAILIILFVKDELTFDTFYSKSDRIYRPYNYSKRGERESTHTATPFSMGRQLWESYEEVEKYSVFTSFNDIVENGDLAFNENVNIASPHFFEIFDFKILSGSLGGALEDPKDVILTREIAEKYLGNINVAGSIITIRVGGEPRDFEVKAVLENSPSNTSIPFSMVVSDHFLKDIFPEKMLTSWFMITGENFILLKEGLDPLEVESKFPSLVDQVLAKDPDGQDREYYIYLQALTDIHLNTELPAGNAPVSDPRYLYILSAIALLIVVMASINFVTLSLSRSFSRSKEIGIRKAAGAHRSQLVTQFISESLFISVISLILGMIIAYFTLPLFNDLSGRELTFNLTIVNISLFVGLALLIGLLAGFYPALVMSGFKPATTLKGEVKIGRGKNILRTLLVGGQFVLSIFLISATLIMTQQLRYLQDKNLGFDKEHVVVVPLNVADARGVRDQVTKGFDKGQALKQALQGKPGIINTALSMHIFESGNWTEIGWIDENDERFTFFYNTIDVDYINTLDIELIMGRNFSEENDADVRRSVLVNEAFVKSFDLENPIGQRIPNDNMIDNEIIGVVKDFHIESLHTAIQPLVLAQNVMIGFSGAQSVNIGSSITPKAVVRVAPGQTQEALRNLRETWTEVYSGEPFDYAFLDENLREQYENEVNLGHIMTSASIIAILIGCLGLFGLAMLTLTARLKEVGIRKVLGASNNSLWLILSSNFLILIVVALVISSPFSWMAMDKWLADFQYRVEITPQAFVLAGVITVVIAILTITYQMLKVIRTNPSEVLRSE